MTSSKNLGLRDSRDRIVDLLGLGETYPLREVSLTPELKVPFGANARLVADPSQSHVRYELRDHNGDGPPERPDAPLERLDGEIKVAVAGDGNSGALELITPAIDENVTYTVLAAKAHPTEDGGTSIRAVYLDQRSRIKVGLDATVPASVVVDLVAQVEHLDPLATADSDARIIHYGRTVTVALVGAQEGVDYELVSLDGDQIIPRSAGVVRGKGEGATVTIESEPLSEDFDLRVRATKTFSGLENRATEIIILDAVMPVRVRANTELSTVATPIVPLGGESSVRIEATQKSATYQLFARPAWDREFTAVGSDTTADVPVPGEPTVHLLRPAWDQVWRLPAGFAAVGEIVQGNGGALDLPLGALDHDTLVVVRVVKSHTTAGENPAQLASAVQLRPATATLVAPNPAPELELQVVMRDGKSTGIVEVRGGEPGVYYHLRRTADGDDLGPPAYFHKLDETDETVNKGISQLVIGVDMVIARASDESDAKALAQVHPPPPRVSTGPLEAGAVLHLHAVKAMSRVAAPLAKTAEITAVPAIDNERVGVDRGSVARISANPSSKGDTYQLRLNGTPITSALPGTDGELVLVSEPVDRDLDFEVLVSPAEDRGIPVHRSVDVSVPLRPTATLQARIVDTPLLDPEATEPSADDATRLIFCNEKIVVELLRSQADVTYRLVSVAGDAETPRSADLRGTGGTIQLLSERIFSDTVLRVRAYRHFYGSDDELAEPRRLLDAQMPVAARAHPRRTITSSDPDLCLNYSETSSVNVARSQRTATYSLFVRPVSDELRVFDGVDTPAGTDLVVDVGVEGRPPVRVRRPPWSQVWSTPEGFVQEGADVPGNGELLALPLPPLTADTIILVRASKAHEGPPQRSTSVQQSTATLLLVRPDPAPSLALSVRGVGTEGAATIRFFGGETGVYYQLLRGADDEPLGQPVYIHDRAEDAQAPGPPEAKRGVGELRIEVDLGVASGDLVPTLDGLTLAVGDTLSILATRALNGLEARLKASAEITAVPEISAAEPTIAAGEAATLTIKASVVGERYQLYVADEAIGEPVDGDGADLTLESGPLDSSTILAIELTRPEAAGLAVTQRVEVPITVT